MVRCPLFPAAAWCLLVLAWRSSSVGALLAAPARVPAGQRWLARPPRRSGVARQAAAVAKDDDEAAVVKDDEDPLSKTSMLKFYGPALGIFLAGPLMSNIDNAVIGRVSGVSALAALSPGTVLADQILYLFSFLGRATTGLVSREYALKGTEGAKEVLRRPLALAFAIGAGFLAPMYLFGTHSALELLQVDPSLRPEAAAYAMIRGLAAPLALAQSVALSALLALRDAATPLRVVSVAALCNLVGDFFMCVWPLQLGAAGAAVATTASTAVGAGMMLQALKKRGLLTPSDNLWFRDYLFPSKQRWRELGSRPLNSLRSELAPLVAYAGPLTAILIARLLGFASMQRTAGAAGVEALAAYQVALNGFVLFAFFAEPLSQTAQALVPTITQRSELRRALKNLASLALGIAPLIAGACAAFLTVCAPVFISDPHTISLVRSTAFPAVFLTVAQLTLTTTVDGCLVGSRDFAWIIALGSCTCFCQLAALKRIALTAHLNPSRALCAVFLTFAVRLGVYASLCSARLALGKGPLGRALFSKENELLLGSPLDEDKDDSLLSSDDDSQVKI